MSKRELMPARQMIQFDLMAQQAPPPTVKAADEPKCEKAERTVCPHAPAAIDAAVDPAGESSAALGRAAETLRQRAAEFLDPRFFRSATRIHTKSRPALCNDGRQTTSNAQRLMEDFYDQTSGGDRAVLITRSLLPNT
jgi:hypothetical protein